MAIPTNREEFKKHCLRRIGGGVTKFHGLTAEQIDDRVDEALYKYARFHYDGSEKVYVAHQLQASEVSSKMITMDQSIIGVTDVFPLGFSTNPSSGNFFNAAAFQVMLSDVIFNAGSGGALSDYVIMRMGLNTMEMVLVGKFLFRYGEKTNQLYLDVSTEKLIEGAYILIEAYRVNDPSTYPDVWADQWLQRYATALIKQNWGQNLSKYSGAQLPGGITVNGMEIMIKAEEEIQKLEDELIDTYSPINADMYG